jgi:diphthamide synthase (EF-2-diphthine--ammonia ligase)
VDLSKLPRTLLGRTFDAALLAALPDGVDPCGEHGEFHSFAARMPGMPPIELQRGEIVEREGFAWIDLWSEPPDSSLG